VIVGRADVVATIARHPLARAMRADKLTLAALQSVALAYLSDDATSIPLWRMATAPIDGLRVRARTLSDAVTGVKVIETQAVAGGGSLPGLNIPSIGIAAEPADVDAVADRLRARGVVARVADGALVCDLRTVDPRDDLALRDALAASLA
jgi:L-seryl-tRNA(Ser) seleniumtransferase